MDCHRTLDKFGLYFHGVGLSKTYGRMFGLFMITAKPITMGYLVEKLQISKSTASIELRRLLTMGAIEKTLLPDERTDFYQLRKNIWNLNLHQKLQDAKKLRAILEEIPKAVEGLEQVKEMENYCAFLETELEILIKKYINFSSSEEKIENLNNDSHIEQEIVEEFVSFRNPAADVTLSGTFTFPLSKGPFPVVILIAGAGQSCRDAAILGHTPFRILAEYLTRRGISVLRFDKRGCGKSTGNFNKATTADFADDVFSGVEFLKSRKEINPKQIGLIGWSEGGLIAPMIAIKSPDVAYIVLMAACGVNGEEFMYGWSESVERAKGASKEAIERTRQHKKMLFDVLKKEQDFTVAAKQLREIIIRHSHSKQELTDIESDAVDMEISYINTAWFRYFISYDPAIALKQVKIPVLALNGELDQQVFPKPNLSIIAKALEDGRNKDYKAIELPRLNHLFQTCNDGSFGEYAKIKETIAPTALNLIAEWVLEKTTRN